MHDDGVLRYNFMNSLQNITMAKIIVILWMSQRTKLMKRSLIQKYRSKFYEWYEIEKNVVNQVSELPLPNALTEKLENIVPRIGDSILNWIRYNDRYIFRSNECSSLDKIDDLIWTSRGSIDYAQTARNILDKPYSTIKNEEKYKLACTYCLEDEISILSTNFSNKFSSYELCIEKCTMTVFWTANLRGEERILCNYFLRRNNLSTNENVLRLLIINYTFGGNKTCNEVAIAYIWNTLSEKEKDRNVVLLFKKLGNQDLRYSLLSSLDYKQQQKVFRECSGDILCDMFNDWLWGEYFVPTALHSLPIMDRLSYLNILKLIIEEVISNCNKGNTFTHERYESILIQLWQNSPLHLRGLFTRYQNGYLVQRLLITSLSYERDMKIVQLIFKDLDVQQKKNMIFKNEGVLYCADFIKQGRWDILRLFIECTLSSEEDINVLKELLLKENGQAIALKLFEHETIDQVEQFLTWGFKSKDRMHEFKLSFAKIDTLLKSIINKKDSDHREIENFFKWCSDGDQKVMNRLKFEFPNSISGKHLILKFLSKDNYEKVDEFLNWSFSSKQGQIIILKSQLYKDKEFFSMKLITMLRKRENPMNELIKFIHWSFTAKKGKIILTEMLLSNNFKLAKVDLNKRIHHLTITSFMGS